MANRKQKRKKASMKGKGRGNKRKVSARKRAQRRVQLQSGGAFFMAVLALARVALPLILRLGVQAGTMAARRLIAHAPKALQRMAIDTAKQQAIQVALKHGRGGVKGTAIPTVVNPTSTSVHNIKSLAMKASRNQHHVTRAVKNQSVKKS